MKIIQIYQQDNGAIKAKLIIIIIIMYLRLFFSDKFRGISLSSLTRSTADKFCRFWINRSCFFSATHPAGPFYRLCFISGKRFNQRRRFCTCWVCSVHLHAIASYAGSGGAREVFDGRSSLRASPKLSGPVVVLRDDGSPAAAWRVKMIRFFSVWCNSSSCFNQSHLTFATI